MWGTLVRLISMNISKNGALCRWPKFLSFVERNFGRPAIRMTVSTMTSAAFLFLPNKPRFEDQLFYLGWLHWHALFTPFDTDYYTYQRAKCKSFVLVWGFDDFFKPKKTGHPCVIVRMAISYLML